MTSSFVRRLCLAIALILAAGRAACADELTTGTVFVRFSGPEGVIATVEITPEAKPLRRWTAHLSGMDRATFHRLPPGRYLVTAYTAGAAAPAATGITIGPDEGVTMTIALATAAGTPVIAQIDRARLSQSLTFDRTVLHDLPSGDSLWGLIDTAAPFVIADRMDNGGLDTAASARVGSRGASWTTTSLEFGDLRAGAPRPSGEMPMYPDLGAVDAVVLSAGLEPPDTRSPGLNIALVPSRPGDALHGGFDASFSGPRMTSTNGLPGQTPIGRIDTFKEAGFQIGGPIRPRVGAFVSGSIARAEILEHARPVQASDNSTTLFSHIVANPTDRDEVRVVAAVQRLRRPYDGRLQFLDPGVWEGDTFVQSQVTWDRQTRRGDQQQISFDFGRSGFTPAPASTAGGTFDRVFDGVIPGPASADVRRFWTVRLDYEPRQRPHAGSLRLTIDAGRTSLSSHVIASPSVAELVDGVPARVWIPQAAADDGRHVTTIAGSIEDLIPAGPHLTFDFGLRGSVSAGSASGAAAGITWKSLSPMGWFRWRPKALDLTGGFRRYYQDVPLDLLAFGDPGSATWNVYRWTDANGNGQFDPGEQGMLVEKAGRGPSVASIDPSLQVPLTDEFTLSASHDLTTATFLQSTIVIRKGRGIPRSVNTGVPLSSYTTLTVPAGDLSDPKATLDVFNRLPASFGKDQFLLTNVPKDVTFYGSVDLEWGFRTPRWYSTIGAMVYRTEGSGGNRGFAADEADAGVVGELDETPNATLFSNGRLFFDRSYVLKWSTTYHAHHDILAAVTARYQDGQPFSRLVLVPSLNQGPEAISADRPGHTRFTFTATVDARIEKGFAIGRHHGALRVDVFNLLNKGYEVEENPVAGLNFRQTIAIQPPRTVRLGFNMTF